jgi:hypothetical protein
LKEIDQDEEFWIKQKPKFESIFKEVIKFLTRKMSFARKGQNIATFDEHRSSAPIHPEQ